MTHLVDVSTWDYIVPGIVAILSLIAVCLAAKIWVITKRRKPRLPFEMAEGMLVADTKNEKLWVRTKGMWKEVAGGRKRLLEFLGVRK